MNALNTMNIPNGWLKRMYILSDNMYITMTKEEARCYAQRALAEGQALVLSCQEFGIFGYQSNDGKHSTLFFTQTRGRMCCCFGKSIRENIADELGSLYHIKKTSYRSDPKAPFVTTYKPIAGWKAVLLTWDEECNCFTPENTSYFGHATEIDAVRDAKEWARSEEIPFIARR